MKTLPVLLLTASAAFAAQCPSGYGFYGALTVDHTKVPSTQTNIPILVSGTYTGLKTTGNGGHITDAQGDDAVFVLPSAPTTLLKWEIESWNGSTGAITYWVKVPSLSSSVDTVLNLCYGNAAVTTDQSDPTNVWDSNYPCVWHLTSLSANSTSTSCTGTPLQGIATTASGKFAGAGDFSGSSGGPSTITYPTQSMTAMTFEIWALSNNNAQDGFIGLKAPVHAEWELYFNGSQVHFKGGSVFDEVNCSPPTQGVYNYYAGTISGTTGRLYINGAQCATATVTAPLNLTGILRLGTFDGTNFPWNGNSDEGRVSNIARSADWITIMYNSADTSTFYSASMDNAVTSVAPRRSVVILN